MPIAAIPLPRPAPNALGTSEQQSVPSLPFANLFISSVIIGNPNSPLHPVRPLSSPSFPHFRILVSSGCPKAVSHSDVDVPRHSHISISPSWLCVLPSFFHPSVYARQCRPLTSHASARNVPLPRGRFHFRRCRSAWRAPIQGRVWSQ